MQASCEICLRWFQLLLGCTEQLDHRQQSWEMMTCSNKITTETLCRQNKGISARKVMVILPNIVIAQNDRQYGTASCQSNKKLTNDRTWRSRNGEDVRTSWSLDISPNPAKKTANSIFKSHNSTNEGPLMPQLTMVIPSPGKWYQLAQLARTSRFNLQTRNVMPAWWKHKLYMNMNLQLAYAVL